MKFMENIPATATPLNTENMPSDLPPEITAQQLKQQRGIILGITFFLVLILAGTVVAVYFLLQPTTDTERIRDVFIIMIAALTLLMGFVLILLTIQLARLINLLQNEIRPILESTNETTRTLRGTAVFMSEHLTEPVVKMNEYSAGLQRLLDILNPGKRSK
jgi:hypothetical protein